MKTLSVIHSLFSHESIVELISYHYGVVEPITCQLLHLGDNDYYHIQTNTHQYVLCIYKLNKYWLQSKDHYLFEVDWLRYLKEKRCPIAYPIQRKDGHYLGEIEASEGLRYYALFSFAAGKNTPLTRKRAFLLGREIARIHLISAKFETVYSRPLLNLKFLLEEPIEAIQKYLGNTKENEQERLIELGARLQEGILSLLAQRGEEWGIIGGDFHGYNQHFLDHRVTLFDFNLCGYGWRAYDLAVFRWLQLSDLDVGRNQFQAFIKGRFLIWKSFLSGYQSLRKLTPAELEAIPLLVQIRQIWLMGAQVRSPAPSVALTDHWWERNFKRLFKKFQ